jgi:chaperonin GroES
MNVGAIIGTRRVRLRSETIVQRCPVPNNPAKTIATCGGQTAMSTATKAKKKATSGVKIQPLGDRVVVEREASESKTAGGIVLPDSAKDKPSRGTIIAIGDGRLLDDGKRSKLQVKVGDKVLFTSYAPETILINDEELLLMREEDILAIID